MKYDVFISYSTKDKKVVEGLCAYLEQHKIRCFVAYRDVDKTAVWAEKIVEGLEDSRMMLVVFSENYNCSDQVNREIEIASEDKKPILTFRLTDTKFKGAKKYYLKNLNWIDAFPHPEESFGSVTNDISRLLGIKIPPIAREEQSNAGGGIAPTPPLMPKKKHKHTLGIALFSIVGIALLCFIIYFNEWGNKGEEKPDVPDVVLVNDSINKPVEDVSIPTNVAAEKPSSQKAEKIDTTPVKAVTTEQQKTTATKAVSTPVKAVTTEQKKLTATQAVSTPVKVVTTEQQKTSTIQAVSTPVKAVTTEQQKTSTTKAVSTPVKEEKATVYYMDKYDYVGYFEEGLASVRKDGKYGLIDKIGREIISPRYDESLRFYGGLARVEKDGKCGFIDKTGKEVIPCIYDLASDFSEGLACVKKDGKYGCIDKTGKEVIPCIYYYVVDLSEGLASVKKDGKWGFIDKTGKEIISFAFDYAGSFSEGLASVKKDGKWGFIDKTGK
ncbi:MAG: WG repeat-containing protein, partial [Flavobacteriales bacterium]|nr:WG repeat-containing protein [Flavobacteriales bacterium]